MAGKSPEDIRIWLQEEPVKSAGHPNRSFAARYALMSLTIDRLPDPSIPEFIASLDDVGVAVTNDGKSCLNRSQSRVVGPSQFKAYESALSFATRELESELTMFARAYNNLRSKQYGKAYSQFVDRGRYYFYRYGAHGSYALPYFAWASVKADSFDEMRVFFDRYPEKQGNFDLLLAKALFSGGQGRHTDAERLLKEAFGNRRHTETGAIFSWYQLVEACEWLFEDSGEAIYRDLALKWAKDYQVVQPMFCLGLCGRGEVH